MKLSVSLSISFSLPLTLSLPLSLALCPPGGVEGRTSGMVIPCVSAEASMLKVRNQRINICLSAQKVRNQRANIYVSVSISHLFSLRRQHHLTTSTPFAFLHYINVLVVIVI